MAKKKNKFNIFASTAFVVLISLLSLVAVLTPLFFGLKLNIIEQVGVIYGMALGLFVLLLLTLYIYYCLDSIFSKKGVKNVQYFIIAVILLICLGIRITAALVIRGYNKDESILNAFRIIYSAIGVISFEGQDGISEILKDPNDVNQVFHWIVVYYGSALYTAASFFGLITLGYNYVFACRVKLFFRRIVNIPLFFIKRNFYIFTSVTEDAYTLANSIKENDPTAYVIFAGDDFEKFDKNNELHRYIRMSGYYYIPMNKRNKDEEKSLLVELGLVSNHFLYNFIKRNQVRIFALALGDDKRKRALESLNSDIVFDEIERVLRSSSSKVLLKNKATEKEDDILAWYPGYVYYYVLSNNELNYEFYEKQIHNLIKKFLLDNPEYQSIPFKSIKKIFQIRVLNESRLIGENLIQKRIDKKLALENNDAINHTKNGVHKAIVFGFGLNGQQSLDCLFENTSGVHTEYYSVPGKYHYEKESENDLPITRTDGFHALICDKRIERIIGDYIEKHPSYLFSKPDDFDKAEDKFINYKLIEDAYKSNPEIFSSNNIKEVFYRMNYPHIFFSGGDYSSLDTDELITKFNKDASNQNIFKGVNSIIIALGDDEDNIKAANTIITVLRQNMCGVNNEKCDTLNIYVNIRDKRNQERLSWRDNIDRTLCDHLNVVVYGMSDDIYTYENIIKEDDSVFVNALYRRNIKHIVKDGEKVEYINNLLNYFTTKEGQAENKIYFALLSLYKKNSNYHSALFAHYTSEYIKRMEKQEGEVNWDYLAEVEHTRWWRYNVSCGCIYGSKILNQINTEITSGMDEVITHEQDSKVYNAYNHFVEEKFETKGDINDYIKSFVKVHDCIAPYEVAGKNIIRKNNKRHDYNNVKFSTYVIDSERDKHIKDYVKNVNDSMASVKKVEEEED